MNLIANILTFLIISLVTGLGSAWYLVNSGPDFTAVSEGPWETWNRVGRTIADPYTRAHITRSGRLPVMSKSLLYFTTVHDSAGRKIDAECDYTIIGDDPRGKWWSIAAYDGAGNLMTNPAARHAFNASNVLRDPVGRYKIAISRYPTPGNWLPVDSEYQVRLILRLHMHATETRTADTTYGLPEIRRVLCR